MGQPDDGSLCSVHRSGRISSGANKRSTPIPRPHSHEIVSRHRAVKRSASGNNVLAGQGSDRGIRSKVALPRILQSAVLGSQDRRVTPSGIRLKILEPVCPQGKVQDDHSQNSDKCDAQGGLGSQYRSERRILSRPYSRPVQTSATIRHSNERRAPCFRIQSSTVRSDLCPPGVYQGNSSPLGHHAHLHAVCLLQYLDDWLLRSPNKSLLARQTSWLLDIIRRVGFVVNVAKSQLTPTQRLIHIGVEYHLDLGLMFPPMTRVQKFEDKISTLMSVPITTAYFFLSLLGLLSSATDAIPLGRLHLRPLQLYLLSHWAPASKDLKALIPVKHDLLDHHLRWWLDRKCTRAGMLLDIPEAQTHLFTDASESGWGAHLDKHQVSGSWSTREATLHINHLRPTRLPGAAERSHCSADVRQCLGSVLHTETGGNSVCAAVPSHSGGTDPSTGCTDHSAGQAHSRGEERVSGSSLQNGQDSAHRMDPPPLCVRSTMHGMGHPQPGPVCNPPQQQASRVCVSHGRPTSRGCRCHVNVMEGNVCLCIPPICDAGASTRESLQGSSLRDDSSRPEMAQSVLVRQTVGTSSRLSFGPATEGRSTVPTTQPPEAPVTTSGVPTRLEAVKRSLQERGFSQAAADQIARGRRQSTRAVYDSKWRVFAGWCTGQSVDPFQVTIQKLADFFVYLFQVKHLNPRTIKGYRSAISSTISACGSRTEFSDSQELGSLIRSFQLERPPQRKIAPQWNLSLVLQSLLKPPFEPIAKCELKFLTLKTVFLVALASGRRRSELHALCFDSHHFRQNQDQSMVTLYPDLDFVAKNQALDAVAEPIKLSAFTSVGGADADRKLCPVRCLLQYRKSTATPECRKGRKKLFISYKPSKSDEIKRATISSWICKLIRLAYESEGSDPRALELHKVSAHEVRALSASASVFRGMTVDSVMQSCTWKSRNTFSDFYLRDMCSYIDDIYVMTSSVAGT